jgi:hypothetical protein
VELIRDAAGMYDLSDYFKETGGKIEIMLDRNNKMVWVKVYKLSRDWSKE